MEERIQRESLSEQIRHALIQQIVSGQRQPGERLVEMKLAREFSTSQTPVREALLNLESMRMVEALPHRGVRVRQISEEEMVEAYGVRGVLEQYAAPAATPVLCNDLEAYRELANEILVAARDCDVPTYAQLDFAFHRAIVEAAGKRTLLQLWDSLAFEFRTPLMLQRHRLDLVKAAQDHFAVIEALVAEEGQLAGRLLREHCESFVSDKARSKE